MNCPHCGVHIFGNHALVCRWAEDDSPVEITFSYRGEDFSPPDKRDIRADRQRQQSAAVQRREEWPAK